MLILHPACCQQGALTKFLKRAKVKSSLANGQAWGHLLDILTQNDVVAVDNSLADKSALFDRY
jgi:hypothetical protein